ncbi:hypothetical protein [Aidingimonas halophila]|uniref:Uncharacterized protein n=1 Tax=Aidingimonas halophila TaxID=574349 RepID=A0A1H2U2T9_9GAMM|nr:hypothetical protein [Aidingimonas halophila]GHC22139.1 hypothetical protein GCM10008094_10640 [Aidingimonas halophila]SDW50533.1 hypothetical protein SAMN05443545_10256 [Aidingimonas halophila]
MNIGFFGQATDVFLEVEVPQKKAQLFEAEYLNITGTMPVLGTGYQYQDKKWGREVRVYFNGEAELLDEFASTDVHVEQGDRPYRSRWAYRINNSDFFWSLVRAGYRLGEN